MSRTQRMTLVIVACALAALILYFATRPSPPPAPPSPEFTLAESKAYFVENRHLGSLYVIEGSLTSNLSAPRCRIRIKASLLDAQGQELAQQVFEAGTQASISELKFLNWDELRARLTPSGQDPCRATTVQPGGSSAFMAVFRDPPHAAASFTLIVSDSQSPPSNP